MNHWFPLQCYFNIICVYKASTALRLGATEDPGPVRPSESGLSNLVLSNLALPIKWELCRGAQLTCTCLSGPHFGYSGIYSFLLQWPKAAPLGSSSQCGPRRGQGTVWVMKEWGCVWSLEHEEPHIHIRIPLWVPQSWSRKRRGRPRSWLTACCLILTELEGWRILYSDLSRKSLRCFSQNKKTELAFFFGFCFSGYFLERESTYKQGGKEGGGEEGERGS